MYCDRVRRARPLLGTLVEISLAGTGQEDLHEAANAAFSEIARIHELMSAHSMHSDVFRVNNSPIGSVVPVDETTWRVLELAADISSASNGVFDVTIGAEMLARGELPVLINRSPDSSATFRDLELLPDFCVRTHRALAIDLGGIAKGYAVDAAVAVLRRNGVPGGCVNAGGDLCAFGAEPFIVQVRDPLEPFIARAQVELRERALATSASYARNRGFGAAGVVLDPRPGGTIATGVSASVRAFDCAVADALAKCLLMLGESSAPLLRRFQADGFLIDGEMQTVIESRPGTASAEPPEVLRSAIAGRGGGITQHLQTTLARDFSGAAP